MNTPVSLKILSDPSHTSSSAADIMKLAMIAVDRGLQGSGLRTKMILTAHDELVFEVPAEEREAAERLVRDRMTGVATMKVPLEVEASFGHTWAAAKS